MYILLRVRLFMSTTTIQNHTEFKLFVGNMPGDVSTSEIESLFYKIGELIEVHIMSGSRSRSGQSSAFVKFASVDACHAAITALNMKGKLRPKDTDLLSVKFAKPPSTTAQPAPSSFICLDGSSTAASTPITTPVASPTSFRPSSGTVKLFIGGLPPYVDRDDLIAIFTPFGKVESVHLMNNNRSKSGQACAFCNFWKRSDAQAAISALAGKYIVDPDLPPITIRFADTEDPSAKRLRTTGGGYVAADEVARKLAEQAATEILLSTVIQM